MTESVANAVFLRSRAGRRLASRIFWKMTAPLEAAQRIAGHADIGHLVLDPSGGSWLRSTQRIRTG